MMRQAPVLIVTDKPPEGELLRDLLNRTAPDRPIQMAASEAEAHELMARNEFEIVFAMFEGGAKQCTHFLNEVWNTHPATVRFFIAEQVSGPLMVSSTLSAHHFLAAPVTEQTVLGALERGDAINRFLRYSDVQPLVSRMRTLPSRPSLYAEVMRELQSPAASPETVGQIVSRDLAISTKLIQLVNSTFYAVQEPVTEPAAAVMLLGFETTASLVLSIEAFARFDKVKPLYFSMDRVWKHSQAIAQSATRIAELAGARPEVVRDACTAGLLHDIGKLALALNFEEEYNSVIELTRSHLPACEAEKQIFGTTHADAGAYLLCLWGLPLPIVEAVAYQHAPASELSGPFSASTALHLAENLAAEAEQPAGAPQTGAKLNYPPELGIEHLMPEFRRVVQTRLGPPAGTGAAHEIKASTLPLPSGSASAPLLEISTPAAKRRRFQFIAFVAGLFSLFSLAGLLWRDSPPVESKHAKIIVEEPPQAAPAPENSLEPSPSTPSGPASSIGDLASKVTLQGILYNGDKSALIINDKLFRLGDLVEGARIVSVDRQTVTLEKDGEQLLLNLP